MVFVFSFSLDYNILIIKNSMGKKTKTVKIVSLLLFIILCLFLSSSFLFAQERKLEAEYPEISGLKPETVKTGLPEYVKYIFNVGIITAALILFGTLIFGGIFYLTSAGQLIKLQAAKDQISAAFLGIIILLSSYIILTTINPQLVSFPFPVLRKVEICKSNDDCLRGFECQEGKCVEARKCEKDEDCPGFPDYACKDKICVYEGKTLIVYEIPLGRMITEGVWEENRTNKIKTLIKDLEDFLTQKIELKKEFKRISSLSKYLEHLTADCQCGNLKSSCDASGAAPVGCNGDPCKEDARGEIEKAVGKNNEKIEKLLDFQKRINSEKRLLEVELNKFAEIEEEISDCGQIYNFAEYLDLIQFYEDLGGRVVTLSNLLDKQADPLNFYCAVGGSALELSPLPKIEFSIEELISSEKPQEVTETEPLYCPVEFTIGNVSDQTRELAGLLSVNMERSMLAIEETVKEMRNMNDLVSQCNDRDCDINCNCVPNPCYQQCPNPFCALFCRARCLTVTDACAGNACPKEKIQETPEKIKESEDEIFDSLTEINQIFSEAASIIKGKENKENLESLKKGLGLCHGPITEEEEADWLLLNCDMAIGSYGPAGNPIGDCHPRNFYCCSYSKEKASQVALFPSVYKDRPSVISAPSKEYKHLESEQGCAKDWGCNIDITSPSQYERDASEPLKDLLACMREELNKIQKQEGIERTIGRISSISDSHLYTGECDWYRGSMGGRGCSHTYGGGKTSAHYGGPRCTGSSYAIDIGVGDGFEKKYTKRIIDVAKSCAPGAYALYGIEGHHNHIHISISGLHNCGSL